MWPVFGKQPASFQVLEHAGPQSSIKPCAISFGTAASQGQFHPGDRAGSGTGIPALLMFCLPVTTQEAPIQIRDSGGQQATGGAEHGTDLLTVGHMTWWHCNPMSARVQSP